MELDDYINWYNHRIHGTLGYKKPFDYCEQNFIDLV